MNKSTRVAKLRELLKYEKEQLSTLRASGEAAGGGDGGGGGGGNDDGGGDGGGGGGGGGGDGGGGGGGVAWLAFGYGGFGVGGQMHC